jgi:hypothetical protein
MRQHQSFSRTILSQKHKWLYNPPKPYQPEPEARELRVIGRASIPHRHHKLLEVNLPRVVHIEDAEQPSTKGRIPHAFEEREEFVQGDAATPVQVYLAENTVELTNRE